MRKILILPIFVAVAGLAAKQYGTDPHTVRPFTATISGSTWITGYQVRLVKKTFAVRQDGSSVEVRALPDPAAEGQTFDSRVILDVANRRRVSVHPLTETITTMWLSEKSTDFHRFKQNPNCLDGAQPAALILGYDVWLKDTTRPFRDGGQLKERSWVSPRLNCFPLRIETVMELPGEPDDNSAQTVITVTEEEPGPSLFEIPSTYVEKTPSQSVAELKRRFPEMSARPCPSCSLAEQRRDMNYYESWRKAGRQPPSN